MAITTSAPEHASSHETDQELRAKQLEQAEELLFTGPEQSGFAKVLFRGEFRASSLFPYPELPESQRATVEAAVAAVREFADSKIDAAAIDREADIPRSVIDGSGPARRAGDDRTRRVGRPGLLADGLLPDHGSDRRPLRIDGRVRQRPSFDRHPGSRALRHAPSNRRGGCRPWPVARSWPPSP